MNTFHPFCLVYLNISNFPVSFTPSSYPVFQLLFSTAPSLTVIRSCSTELLCTKLNLQSNSSDWQGLVTGDWSVQSLTPTDGEML